jgi:hypothetical protein
VNLATLAQSQAERYGARPLGPGIAFTIGCTEDDAPFSGARAVIDKRFSAGRFAAYERLEAGNVRGRVVAVP